MGEVEVKEEAEVTVDFQEIQFYSFSSISASTIKFCFKKIVLLKCLSLVDKQVGAPTNYFMMMRDTRR